MQHSSSITILFFFSLLATPAYAAEEFDPLQSGLKMLIGLGIVLALLLCISFLLKRNMKSFQNQDKGNIKIVEVKHVMPKKTLMLIEVNGQQYLAGGGSDSIDTIVPLKSDYSFKDILDNQEKSQ